jgi:SAM-dependent methyltransferase
VVSSSARAVAERPFYALHAEAYDLLITDPVDPWVDAVHERLRSAGHSPAAVLDAGCGTGRHAAALIARGHRLDLADASAELLSQAAKRCPSARTILADLCEMTTPSTYDAVTCRGVLNDMITDRERRAAVGSLVGCLRPGGLLFLDVRAEQASRERADGTAHRRQVDPRRRSTARLHRTEHLEPGNDPRPGALPVARHDRVGPFNPGTPRLSGSAAGRAGTVAA